MSIQQRVRKIEERFKPNSDNFSFLQRLTDEELDLLIKSKSEELSVSCGVPLDEIVAIMNGPGMLVDHIRNALSRHDKRIAGAI
ncbi:MAG: hypothetical protein NTV58_14560 [Deltaproteobacteria bacterium]|nr:hypothetical protein [Deltaproteobacteria bacterium]